MCIGVCLRVYMCTTCVLDASADQKKGLNSLGLELQMLVNQHVSVRNQTLALYESIQYS